MASSDEHDEDTPMVLPEQDFVKGLEAWLSEAWPPAIPADYAEWLKQRFDMGTPPLWQLSPDVSTRVGWRSVTLATICTKIAAASQECNMGEEKILVYLAGKEGEAFSHHFVKGHMRMSSLLWALCYTFVKKIDVPAWLRATAEHMVKCIHVTECNRRDAAFRGLATCVKNEAFMVTFSYVELANSLQNQNSAFSGLSGEQFGVELRKFVPSIDQTKMDLKRFTTFLGRCAPAVVSKLLELQVNHNQGRDFASLSWWTRHSEYLLPGQRQRKTGSAGATTEVTAESQLLMVKRLVAELLEQERTSDKRADGLNFATVRDPGAIKALAVGFEAAVRHLEPDIQDELTKAFLARHVDADIRSGLPVEKWVAHVKSVVRREAAQQQRALDAKHAEAAAEAARAATMAKAAALQEDDSAWKAASLQQFVTSGKQHWLKLVELIGPTLVAANQVLDDGKTKVVTSPAMDGFAAKSGGNGFQFWDVVKGGSCFVVLDVVPNDEAPLEMPIPVRHTLEAIKEGFDACGLLVLPSEPGVSSILQILVGHEIVEKYSKTLSFRLCRYGACACILVVKHGADGAQADQLTMTGRVVNSTLWGTGLVVADTSKANPTKSSTDRVLFPAAWDATFWAGILSSSGARPIRAGDSVIELQFSVNLVAAIGKEIRDLGGEARWLGSQVAPSPAKIRHINEYLETMARAFNQEQSSSGKRSLKAKTSVTDDNLATVELQAKGLAGKLPGGLELPVQVCADLHETFKPTEDVRRGLDISSVVHPVPVKTPPLMNDGDDRGGSAYDFRRLPKTLKMAKFCLDNKVVPLQSLVVKDAWGLFPAHHIRKGDVVMPLDLTFQPLAMAQAQNEKVKGYGVFRLSLFKKSAGKVTHNLGAVLAPDCLASYIRWVPEDTSSTASNLTTIACCELQFDVNSHAGAMEGKLVATMDIPPFAYELGALIKDHSKATKEISEQKGSADAEGAMMALMDGNDGNGQEISEQKGSADAEGAMMALMDGNDGNGQEQQQQVPDPAAVVVKTEHLKPCADGSRVEFTMGDGLQKITHPKLGLGYFNSTASDEDGKDMSLEDGCVVHTVMNVSSHTECKVAESMEVAFQLKASDWIFLAEEEERFGKVSDLLTPKMQVQGHTLGTKVAKSGKSGNEREVLTITADKPVLKWKVGKYPVDNQPAIKVGWPWVDGTPAVPVKGLVFCWTLKKSKENVYEPTSYDLTVTKDIKLAEEPVWLVQVKPEKAPRPTKKARVNEQGQAGNDEDLEKQPPQDVD